MNHQKVISYDHQEGKSVKTFVYNMDDTSKIFPIDCSVNELQKSMAGTLEQSRIISLTAIYLKPLYVNYINHLNLMRIRSSFKEAK